MMMSPSRQNQNYTPMLRRKGFLKLSNLSEELSTDSEGHYDLEEILRKLDFMFTFVSSSNKFKVFLSVLPDWIEFNSLG